MLSVVDSYIIESILNLFPWPNYGVGIQVKLFIMFIVPVRVYLTHLEAEARRKGAK